MRLTKANPSGFFPSKYTRTDHVLKKTKPCIALRKASPEGKTQVEHTFLHTDSLTPKRRRHRCSQLFLTAKCQVGFFLFISYHAHFPCCKALFSSAEIGICIVFDVTTNIIVISFVFVNYCPNID